MQKDIEILKEALHYMHVSELKEVCKELQLPFSSKKGMLIQRICHFLQTGNILCAPDFPSQSKAQKGVAYPLAPHTLILYGNYKNDLATRTFLKSLIGEYFHFTAAGIDWIEARWLAGNPPTYAEFAAYWQETYEARKHAKSSLKQEWAYLNFIQDYVTEHPSASRQKICQQWELKRTLQVQKAKKLLTQLCASFV